MAITISLPFVSVTLQMNDFDRLVLPVNDMNAVRINESDIQLKNQFAERLQKLLFDEGEYKSLLDHYQTTDYTLLPLSISFPSSRDNLMHPPFSITYDCYYSKNNRGFRALVPALSLETRTEKETDIKKSLTDIIRLDFARKKRLTDLKNLISTIWFESSALYIDQVTLNSHSLTELNQVHIESSEEWLPKIAGMLDWSGGQLAFGLEDKINQIVKILQGTYKKNILLVGPVGVGKTVLVWEMSRLLSLYGISQKIWETSASVMIKELVGNTGWQESCSQLCRELGKKGDILFVRNFMELFEVGQYEGNQESLADYFRNFISRGEITMITECNEEELARIELRSPNYTSHFQIIRLEEPGEQLESIILRKTEILAAQKGIRFQKGAIREAVLLHKRFMPYSGFPGKPIRFLESILLTHRVADPKGITRKDIIRYFCEESGLPLFMVDPEIAFDTLAIRKFFHDNVFGQAPAVDGVVDVLASIKTALTRTGKPIASFLFAGPTGVGKTEMAKMLASCIFGNSNRMVRFDMSEYSNPLSVMRLTGMSYHEDGLLTSAVRQEPFCVLLFDEIEKAHPVFFDLLLQMLGEGRLSDSKGKSVNFCSTIIVMTSNIGADSYSNNRISWTHSTDLSALNQHFMKAIKSFFRPELFNRIDLVIPFMPLDRDTMRFVVDREIRLFRQREGILFRRMDLQLDNEVLDYLASAGYSPKHGARQLQRTIREKLVLPLAALLNNQDIDDQLNVRIFMYQQELTIEMAADPRSLDLLFDDLDKLNNADFAGNLRRKMDFLKEGNLYLKLANEWEMLDYQKKKMGPEFWSEKDISNRYSILLDAFDQILKLEEVLQKTELDSALMAMGEIPGTDTMDQELTDLEEDFFSLQKNLYALMYPQHNHAILDIYGSAPEKVALWYQQLFDLLELEYELESIWYRESYYNDWVQPKEADDKKTNRKKREEYLLVTTPSIASIHPPQEGDICYGIRFRLSGTGAWLLVRNEKGGQRWKWSVENDRQYYINVGLDECQIPTDIHRSNFYKTSEVRRTFEPQAFKDSLYKIRNEVTIEENIEMMYRWMIPYLKIQIESSFS